MLKSPAFSTSFLESRMIQKLKSRKSRIKPGLFAFLLAERIIFGKKTQKSQVSLVRYLTFSLVCGMSWQRGAPAGSPAVRVVGACSPVGCVQAPVSAPASVGAGRSPLGSSTRGGSRDKSVPRFPPSFPVFPIRLHLPLTVLIPSSTQNAPGFALFGRFRVRFAVFTLFFPAKFGGQFLCILPHSGYKLKPSVIPCRREVSFLT